MYGASKLAGEIAVLNASSKSTVIRTSWVYSEYGNNFVRTMLKLRKETNELKIVDDQVGCPTYAGDIAKIILDNLLKDEAMLNTGLGVQHFSGSDVMTWYGFAKKIFKFVNELEKLNYQIDNLKFTLSTQIILIRQRLDQNIRYYTLR